MSAGSALVLTALRAASDTLVRGFKPEIDLSEVDLNNLIEDAMALAADQDVSKRAKKKAVRQFVAEQVDEIVKWGKGPLAEAFEALDGPVIKAFLAIKLKIRFRQLRRAGRI